MVQLEHVKSRINIRKSDVALALHVGRNVVSVLPEVWRDEELREAFLPHSPTVDRLGYLAGKQVGIAVLLGRAGSKGMARLVPQAGKSAANAVFAKTGWHQQADISPEAVFTHDLHELETGLRKLAGFFDSRIERVLVEHELDHARTPEAKEKATEAVRFHTDPLVGLGLFWISLAKTEKPPLDSRFEPRSDVGYITDYAFVLEQGGMRPDYAQEVVVRLQEHFLQHDGDMGPSDGLRRDLAPYRSQLYRPEPDAPQPHA